MRNLCLALPPQSTSEGSSVDLMKLAVYPWLYRDIDVDFAGAESAGTGLLLKNLLNTELANQKYVKQLTITIGPLVFQHGPKVIGRYYEYILRLISSLPNLKIFR